MKKIILIALAIATLGACAPKEKTAEQLTAEISKTKVKISDLNEALITLEQQLAQIQESTPDAGDKVRVEMLQTKPFASFIKTSAIIEAVNSALVSPEINGRIQTIHVKEGQKVNSGQLLVSLDHEILQKSLAEMDKGLELTKTLFEKQKELFDQGVGSEMQYLEVKNRYESMIKARETLHSQMDMAKIKAPFSGYVETVFMKEGESASPGRQIIQLINLEDLYLNTQLAENYLSSIHKGDSTWITFPNTPEIEKSALISQIGKMIDPNSRTFSVRVDIKNVGEVLKPNMLATLKFRDFYDAEALIVPTILIRQDPNGSFVYVARQHDGDTFAIKTYVQTGRSDGTETLITSGLSAGDLIITNGYNQVKDGTKLDIIN